MCCHPASSIVSVRMQERSHRRRQIDPVQMLNQRTLGTGRSSTADVDLQLVARSSGEPAQKSGREGVPGGDPPTLKSGKQVVEKVAPKVLNAYLWRSMRLFI